MPWRGLVLASDLNIRHYSGASESVRREVFYWNSAIGYRFLQDNNAEIRLEVADILGQNSDVNRKFSDTFIEEIHSKALTRYVMMTFSWNFRIFSDDAPRENGREGRSR